MKKPLPHPAHMWPTRWFWHDRSDQPADTQIIDLLTDIRSAVTLLVIVAMIATL